MARIAFRKIGIQPVKLKLLGGVLSQLESWNRFIIELYGDDVKLEDSLDYALNLYLESSNVIALEFRKYQLESKEKKANKLSHETKKEEFAEEIKDEVMELDILDEAIFDLED